MVSEAGASVYSASDAAREEFPELDVTVRGAISIARRLQDPLAELVKIDPKSIGVGQYQHDVSQTGAEEEPRRGGRLLREPGGRQPEHRLVSPAGARLRHRPRAGAGDRRAPRRRQGCSGRATQLLEVPRFSKKTFEQAAGFLRIPDGEHPLDNTGVHPERYARAGARWPRELGVSTADLLGAGVKLVKQARVAEGGARRLHLRRHRRASWRSPAAIRARRSCRSRSAPTSTSCKDLQPGMVCPGIVTNVTNFGAFVDIGVHQDGLVHISQLADHFVKDPQRRGERRRSRHGARAGGQARQETDRADHEGRTRHRTPGARARQQDQRPPPAGERSPPAPRRRPKPAAPFNNPFAAALANKTPPRR